MVENTARAQAADGDAANLKAVLTAYVQSEKIKAGLIWASQMADQVAAASGAARTEGSRMLQILARMVADEAQLAARVTGDESWRGIDRNIQMALVMIQSGVPEETGFHLTRALAGVTRIGSQAGGVLQKHNLM